MHHAFICDYVRTPIGKFGGALAHVRTDDLAALPIRALVERNRRVDWDATDDVILGCANQAGEDNRNVARMALLLAGVPQTVPGVTVNRLCGSGMESIVIAARSIWTGDAELVIAGGVEGMSRAPFVMAKAETAFSRSVEIHDTTLGWRFINARFQELFGTDSMPETAENVASEYSVNRADQDAFAYRSQIRAARAIEVGRIAREIIPVPIQPPKGASYDLSHDEHPRGDTTIDRLAKLPTPFRDGGTVTAGNSSGINDGSAALLIASDRARCKYNLTPIARITAAAAAGIVPRVMGIAPVTAVRRLCARLNLSVNDFDVIELNEAFASQALAVLRELEIPDDAEHVNPNGGAIALGHPLGMSGARIVGTAACELRDRKLRRALATICIGVGQGLALALESV